MLTAPIRWICGKCYSVARIKLEIFSAGEGPPIRQQPVHFTMPLCCGKEMLLAGEPKLDVHGLREKDCWVDPVDNIIPKKKKGCD